MKHDVVIIGGSLAGAACVRELTRLGIDAVALERDTFPRRKVCGGFLSPGAVDCLEQLKLLDEVRSAGAVEIRSARIRSAEVDVDIRFKRAALGISRNALDDLVAKGARVQQGCMVRDVRRQSGGFVVHGIECAAVIDAAGKLSRFSRRTPVEEFGIQYFENRSCGTVLDFWLMEDGYGGAVSVEGGRSNVCFLLEKQALRRYLDRQDCIVTGPLAYDRLPGDVIAIGDAAGMVDPFCGEGMRHALESGVLAARIVASGIRSCAPYEEMKWKYEREWRRRWWLRRIAGKLVRRFSRQFRQSRKLIRVIGAIGGP